MPRPPKYRWVESIPGVTYFKPAGQPLRHLEEVTLAVEELEAIRLKDVEGLEQEDCALRMGVSRPTFFRILNAARGKVADALVTGKAIRVEGGYYQLIGNKIRCQKCDYEWEAEHNKIKSCPRCGSDAALATLLKDKGCRHRHRRRGEDLD